MLMRHPAPELMLMQPRPVPGHPGQRSRSESSTSRIRHFRHDCFSGTVAPGTVAIPLTTVPCKPTRSSPSATSAGFTKQMHLGARTRTSVPCRPRGSYPPATSAGVRKQMHLGASTRTSVPSSAGSQCNLAFSFITIPHNFMPKTMFTSKRPGRVGKPNG